MIFHFLDLAAQKATSMAGISSSDVDVAEVHDAFAICEPMALEALKIADTRCKIFTGIV